MKKNLLLVCLLVLSTLPGFAKKKISTHQEIYGVVDHCHDGDTCTVMADDKKIKVRFSGIDAPELKQENGKAAQRFTEGLIKGKAVKLDCEGSSYDRMTCIVFLKDQDINSAIVRNGFAYDVPKYSKGRYQNQMMMAKTEQLGFWKNREAPVESPFCFRHKKDKRCLRDASYIEK
jgi:micrococcal nuclease